MTDDVELSYETALSSDVISLLELIEKPWCQLIDYVWCSNGTLVDLFESLKTRGFLNFCIYCKN